LVDDETWADIFSETGLAAEPEPAAAEPLSADASAPGTPSPSVAAAPAESGTVPAVTSESAPAVAEAEPLSPEARAQQLEAQLAAVAGERDQLVSSVTQQRAAEDAAKAARDAAVQREVLNRENAIAKGIYQGLLDEGEPEKAKAFAWMHDGMTKRINQALATVEQQDKAIRAYVYVTQLYSSPEAFSEIIEIGDSVAHLSGEEMIAAVNSIKDQQLNAREGSLQDKQKITELEAQIAALQAQSTDPRAHLVEGGPSQVGQKPESEWTFDDHWNYARRAPVGVGAS
jgi:hypothetical protein